MEELLKKETVKISKKGESFIEFSIDDFIEYYEKYKKTFVEYNKDYAKLRMKIEKQKTSYPNLRKVLEERKAMSLNINEVKALIKLLEFESEIDLMENKICFKLGMKETVKILL